MSTRGDCEGDAIVLAGATGRVGAATLTTLVREGARVVVLSRDEARARTTIAEALEPGQRERAIAVQADLSVAADAERAVAFAVAKFGRIDAAVNLAGSGVGWTPVSKSSLDDLHATVRAFLDTAYTLTMAALRAMLAQPYREGARS